MDCQHTMSDYEYPQTPEIDEAYRAAYKALAALISPRAVIAEEESSLSQLLAEFPLLVDKAEFATIAQLGAPISWQAPFQEGDWNVAISVVDRDGGTHDFGDARFEADAFTGPRGVWRDGVLNRVGMAYKRACGWDHAPGDAGVWLLMLAPERASGGDEGLWFFSGRVVGFVVVYDRDEDDVYESIGHIWTATAWRRRGIARQLLSAAQARFPITDVEEPYTPDGAEFLNACREPDMSQDD
jgi:GNAT superfamily N-acetyltransferase